VANIRKNKILSPYLDEERLDKIFARLEERPGEPQSQRVERVLELLSGLGEDAPTSEKSRILTALRKVLERYRWIRRVYPTREGLRVLSFAANREYLSTDDIWEYTTVQDLLDLVPYLGARPRIRRCRDERCQRWFFAAKRDDQWFCDSKCKQHHYDTETREEKKAYMRKRYAEQKERARNPKSGVGLRTQKAASPRKKTR
jgi:hypothetical protein